LDGRGLREGGVLPELGLRRSGPVATGAECTPATQALRPANGRLAAFPAQYAATSSRAATV
jgi:hypothetical protein